MGLDVMSRYGPRRVPHSPTASTKPLDPTTTMADALVAGKSLTPQRKHHKLLKDGTEVWSDDVEKIFVQGLKEYWESPWATYSRGRSRWRNQFLVDHLKKFGIERSKKQVASHIQVLRNMWREQPEFHLVAGGEELFMENGLLASPNNTGRGSGSPQSAHSTPVRDASSLSPSTSNSDLPNAIPASISMPQMSGPSGWPGPSGGPLLEQSYDALIPAFDQLPNGGGLSPHRMRSNTVKLEPLMMHAGLFTLPTVSSGGGGHLLDNSLPGTSSHHPVPHTSTRLYAFNLWAEGMAPFMVNIDQMATALTNQALVQVDQSSILLRIKLSLPAFDDYGFPSLHGFQAAVTLSERWSSEAKCITKSYAGSTPLGPEIGHLDSASDLQAMSSNDFTSSPVSVGLSDTALSRCRWMEMPLDTITQQIIVDGVVVAAIVYHLQRSTNVGAPPSAELIGVQRYKPTSTSRRTHARTQSQPYIASSQHSPTRLSHPAGTSAAYFNPPSFGGPNDIPPFTPYSHLDFPTSSMPMNGFSYNAPSHSPDMFGVVETSSDFSDRPYMSQAPRSL
ncbi:hypothetical protein QCA50_003160 [Cerrena zonata]|uniref:TEA domain-containing protein n=1 Tax=Cerrena zonata TaxID=2478898 RepID=A0AAW0GJM6_9APHY